MIIKGQRRQRGQWWPGLIAGASDIDPTTVATIAVIGSTTIYGLSWLALLTFPMLATVQRISTQLGVATHDDLQRCVRRHFGRSTRLLLLGSVLAVSAITAGADLGGGAAALGLLLGTSTSAMVVPLAIVLVAVTTLGAYGRLEGFLRAAMLPLASYVVALLFVHVHWTAVLRSTFVPHFQWNNDWTSGALALIGTTVTSYVFVWQTSRTARKRPASNCSKRGAEAPPRAWRSGCCPSGRS